MNARIFLPDSSQVDEATSLLMVRSKGEARRYIRAGEIVLSGSIDYSDTEGWTVASQSKAGAKAQLRYTLKPGACTCYDFVHHGGESCKHLDAVAIYIRCLANALDAAMQPRHSMAGATAQGWQGMCDGLNPDDALAAAEYAAAQPADTRIEALPGDAPHRRNLYDKANGGAGICRAQQQPDGRWRPCAAVDTVAWARWLGWQQGVLRQAQEPAVEVATVEVEIAPAPMFWNGEPVDPADMEPTPVEVESTYKYDRRMKDNYGRAPVLQMKHDAYERRREAQADARMIDELDRQFSR